MQSESKPLSCKRMLLSPCRPGFSASRLEGLSVLSSEAPFCKHHMLTLVCKPDHVLLRNNFLASAGVSDAVKDIVTDAPLELSKCKQVVEQVKDSSLTLYIVNSVCAKSRERLGFERLHRRIPCDIHCRSSLLSACLLRISPYQVVSAKARGGEKARVRLRGFFVKTRSIDMSMLVDLDGAVTTNVC